MYEPSYYTEQTEWLCSVYCLILGICRAAVLLDQRFHSLPLGSCPYMAMTCLRGFWHQKYYLTGDTRKIFLIFTIETRFARTHARFQVNI